MNRHSCFHSSSPSTFILIQNMGNRSVHAKIGSYESVSLIINLSTKPLSAEWNLSVVVNGSGLEDEELIVKLTKQLRKKREEFHSCSIDRAIIQMSLDGDFIQETTIPRLKKFLYSNGIRNIQLRLFE